MSSLNLSFAHFAVIVPFGLACIPFDCSARPSTMDISDFRFSIQETQLQAHHSGYTTKPAFAANTNRHYNNPNRQPPGPDRISEYNIRPADATKVAPAINNRRFKMDGDFGDAAVPAGASRNSPKPLTNSAGDNGKPVDPTRVGPAIGNPRFKPSNNNINRGLGK